MLQALQIGEISIRICRPPNTIENFGRFPTPVFNMAIGKRKVGTLPVAVSRQIQPVICPITVGRKNPKGSIPNVFLLRVNQNK